MSSKFSKSKGGNAQGQKACKTSSQAFQEKDVQAHRMHVIKLWIHVQIRKEFKENCNKKYPGSGNTNDFTSKA